MRPTTRAAPGSWILPVILTWALPIGLGCGSDNATTSGVEIGPIQVDSVEVQVLESSPPRAAAHVQGVIGDGCSELHSVEQERSGSTVNLTILRERPLDAVCIQIARLYDDTIPLEGTFPPGRYVLRVNSLETVFTTE